MSHFNSLCSSLDHRCTVGRLDNHLLWGGHLHWYGHFLGSCRLVLQLREAAHVPILEVSANLELVVMAFAQTLQFLQPLSHSLPRRVQELGCLLALGLCILKVLLSGFFCVLRCLKLLLCRLHCCSALCRGRGARLDLFAQCCDARLQRLVKLLHDYVVKGTTIFWLLLASARQRQGQGFVEVEICKERLDDLVVLHSLLPFKIALVEGLEAVLESRFIGLLLLLQCL
mmetsp:Transcript_72346/g.125503  ORF Transcript_72346/g.125503 Transcript_72346/m.125503 type:complete len:228 (-) Transcript_72346:636-1319(-)